MCDRYVAILESWKMANKAAWNSVNCDVYIGYLGLLKLDDIFIKLFFRTKQN
jgi:hypothetical protein